MTKILLVEDDKSLREIYGVRLLAEGYDIVSAGDGEEALAMAIKDRPDLIVSDVMMPKISGFDMLDILRSTTETKGIKVIMMTALSSEDQRLRGVALGADRYLVKSQVGIEDVVRTVHEVLADAPLAPGSSPAPAPAPVAVPSPAPAAVPVQASPVAPRPSAPAAPTPFAAPSAPVTAPAPSYTAPAVSTPAPAAPEPVAPVTPSAPAGSALPQPTAPFSTPRPGTLADRVIEPLPTVASTEPNIDDMMKQALEEHPAGSPPAQPEPSGLNFEETPHPTEPIPAAPPAPTPPSLTPPPVPQPPQTPNTGI
jgi:CheY-like chemotaxis protein